MPGAERLPDGHAAQAAAPRVGAKRPDGHPEQCVCPVCGWYCPSAQPSHCVAPSREYCPEPQAPSHVTSADPPPPKYPARHAPLHRAVSSPDLPQRPATHAPEHSALAHPPTPYLPAAHAYAAEEPCSVKCPGGAAMPTTPPAVAPLDLLCCSRLLWRMGYVPSAHNRPAGHGPSQLASAEPPTPNRPRAQGRQCAALARAYCPGPHFSHSTPSAPARPAGQGWHGAVSVSICSAPIPMRFAASGCSASHSPAAQRGEGGGVGASVGAEVGCAVGAGVGAGVATHAVAPGLG